MDEADLVDMPDAECRATLHHLYANERLSREQALAAREQAAVLAVDPLADPKDRREVFLAVVGKQIVMRGTNSTIDFLARVYKFPREVARTIVKEARRLMAEASSETTQELRAIGLPSSRSLAFTKEAWQAVGGYPEWLDYCEDLVFDLALLARYQPFAFAPEAIAYFRPRSSLRAFFKQYYLYARGDGKAHLWLKRHLLRYATYLIGLPGIAMLSAFSAWWLVLYPIGAAFYLKRPSQRLWPRLHELNDGPAQSDRIGARYHAWQAISPK